MNTQQDLAAVAFPRLDDAQMATLAGCAGASLKTYAAGQTLIRVGERDFKFFVVESGAAATWLVRAGPQPQYAGRLRLVGGPGALAPGGAARG